MGIGFSDVTAQKLAFITNRRELYFQVKWYSRESSFRYDVRGNNLKVKWVFDIKSNMPIQHRSLELFLYPLYFQSNANYIPLNFEKRLVNIRVFGDKTVRESPLSLLLKRPSAVVLIEIPNVLNYRCLLKRTLKDGWGLVVWDYYMFIKFWH